jgi:Domain of unknown function DUF29
MRNLPFRPKPIAIPSVRARPQPPQAPRAAAYPGIWGSVSGALAQRSWAAVSQAAQPSRASTIRQLTRKVGRSEKRAIESDLTVLLTHLLKYRFQPDQRSSSWRGSIVEHRRRLRKLTRESPSLRPHAREVYAESYADGREQAAAETGLPLATFPADPPFTLEQALDPQFLPD